MAYNGLEFHAIQNGFSIADVAGDGDCFYHASYRQMTSAGLIQDSLEPDGGEELRRKLWYYLLSSDDNRTFREEYETTFSRSFEIFINELIDGDWADHFAIRAFAHMWNISINILDNIGRWIRITPRNGEGTDIYIGYIIGVHYVALENIHDSITQPQSEVLDIISKEKGIVNSAELQTNSVSNKRKYQESQNKDKLCNKKGKVKNKIQSSPHTPKQVNTSNEKRKMTPTENQRAYRARMTNEAREQALELGRKRKAATRAAQSQEEREHQRENDRSRKAAKRASMTDNELKQHRNRGRNSIATIRAAMSGEEREKQRENVRNKQALTRAAETEEETEQRALELGRKRKAATRAAQSQEEREHQRENDRSRKAAKRASMTDNELEQHRNRGRNSIAAIRAAMSGEEREKQRENVHNKQALTRAAETEEETEQRLEQNRIRWAATQAALADEERRQRVEQRHLRNVAMRAAETVGDREQRCERDRQQRSTNSVRNQSKAKIATKTPEILQGTIQIPNLLQSTDSIGSMNMECIFCGALKFKNETFSICCGGGKVRLPPFSKPPKEIYHLWLKDTREARLFRRNSRSLNNAVCLSSLSVQEKRFEGFSPSVIFQGAVIHRIGPICAEPGVQPRFAQLYILDQNQETTTRFANMNLPVHMTQNEKQKMKKLMETVQKAIHQYNPYVHKFKQVLEIPDQDLQSGKIILSASAKPQEAHARTYNLPANHQELSVVTNEKPHDLVIRHRGGGLTFISDLNSKAMPLHFTLLFINGTPGWHLGLTHTDGVKRLSSREFFAFHMNVRNTESDFLFRAGRLFQEWILYSWITCESQRLTYVRFNQKNLRADTYKNLYDTVTKKRQEQLNAPTDSLYQNEQEKSLGRMVLPSSYIGSPRWYNSKFQDAMAIVRHYGKPTLFITMTCNPTWPEIKECLAPDQTAHDRPDIVARVFKLKKDQLMNDIMKGNIFGKAVAHLWVIEFQKRGLPHVHILIILANEDRPKTAEQVDQIVCAELPPDPSEKDISEEEKAKRQQLWDIVISNMIHGPCGVQNPSCVCMDNKVCTKNFPKPFQKKTVVDESKSYPVYRRRSPEDGGQSTKKGEIDIDNSWVVPYNPYLSLKYNCHINVEICISPKAAKYLYKYVTKGPDRAMVSAEVEGENRQNNRDEIKEYQDMRCVSSGEAIWHLYAFPITENKPPINVLRLHLDNEQHVFFVGGEEGNVVDQGRETELTAFFRFNTNEKAAKGPGFDPAIMPRYIDLPERYTYKDKEWHTRKRQFSIGRVHTVNPLAGDVFYLRILLHHDHCRGKISFKDLMHIDGRLCSSYQEVCRELGLLSDDQEWSMVLTSAAETNLSSQIRALYVIILMFCQPSDPKKLFEDFWTDWNDDFKRKGELNGNKYTDHQLKIMVRLDLQVRLLSYEKDLPDFGLDPMTLEEKACVSGLVNIEEPLIRDEKDYDVNKLETEWKETYTRFTATQKCIFNEIMVAVKQNKSLLLFISARGGCGKTFLLNTVLKAVRSLEKNGCVALAMGTTGIAAQLLDLGRTFHSRMKAPLQPDENSTLNITAQSSLAKLVRMARLLLIDEATMLHRFYLEALDRTLRDLMNKPNIPFGGKIIILAGDFRQCLPVVVRANRAQIVKACINKSYLWQQFKVHSLTENMRVKASGDPILENFDKWTLSLGDGTSNDKDGRVIIPEEMRTTIKENTIQEKNSEVDCMKHFCQIVFPNLETNMSDPRWLEGRAVLAPTNNEVDKINDLMESWVPGVSTKLSSADTLENYKDVMRFNTEYLNTLCPNGFPRHIISLKPGMPLMLLRNLSPKEGLCNGTKLIYVRIINKKLLLCKLAGSDKNVLIPRIKLFPNPGTYPFDWSRLQFPVRVAFSTTINKSQGQTLKHIGVWLRSPVFSHGQFYVACSRVGSPVSLKLAIKQQLEQQDFQTENVVFKEVLLSS